MSSCVLQNDNDPTILSGWQCEVPVEEFFDVISEVHCRGKGHIGSKKTVTEVRLVNKILFGLGRTAVSEIIIYFM